MARPKAASWSQLGGSWDCRCGSWASERRRGICCRLIRKSLWSRCSPENPPRRHGALRKASDECLVATSDWYRRAVVGSALRAKPVQFREPSESLEDPLVDDPIGGGGLTPKKGSPKKIWCPTICPAPPGGRK